MWYIKNKQIEESQNNETLKPKINNKIKHKLFLLKLKQW